MMVPEASKGPDAYGPRVSVVVPNYNHARFLRRRIDSIFAQTFQDFELILLDDCSTDESRSILCEYASPPRVRIEFNDSNSGSTFKQWNKGVRLAHGKYVWIAESDDYADNRLLEQLVSRLEAEPSAAFSYCRSWRVSADGELDGFSDYYLSHLNAHRWTADFEACGLEECRNFLFRRNTVPNASSVVFRREAYWQAGGADEKLVFCGDWKVWASMALAGGTVIYLAEPLNYHRFHQMSVTAESQRLGIEAAEVLHVIGWILEKVTPDEPLRAALRENLFYLWSPPVLNTRIPIGLRWTILNRAKKVDPCAVRRLVRPALAALRLTASRRYRALRAHLAAPPESTGK